MSWQQVSTEEGSGWLNDEGVLDDDGEEDGIDLEGYEEYLQHLTSKAAIRPCSARVVRPMPTESPQFFMANSDNPVPTRPSRPISAHPRMRSTLRTSLNDRTLNGSQPRSNGAGVRRKRQGEKMVHARIRAVYNDVGHSSVPMKQMSAPYSATSTLNSKSKGLQEADIHDEYYRLLDSESELKAAYLQEQQKRVKAVSHVRRLEEIIAMKDRKIESLLHGKAVGADRTLSTSRSVAQREMAERDRQFHALTQKLRQKIAQQSQLLSSYEEAMQSLRSGIKSTNLMELEEERSQLYQELRHHQELLDQQRLEWEAHQQMLVAFAEAEASSKLQIAKLQQENKVISHEKRKLDQEVGFLKSRVELLQSNLNLEQRKRTYDREFSEGVGKHTSSSPTQKVMLVQALVEMKNLMRMETVASIKREKLKSPKAGAIPPRPNMSVAAAPPTVPTTSAPKIPSRSMLESPRHPRPSSTHSHGTAASKSPSTSPGSGISDHNTKIGAISAAATSYAIVPQTPTFQDQGEQGSKKFDLHPGGEVQVGRAESKRALVATPVKLAEPILSSHDSDIVPNDKDMGCADTNMTQASHHAENEPSEQERSFATTEADPQGGQQSGEVHFTPAVDEHGAGQFTNEELSEMQLQKLAAAESALRFDVDDDLESELSADLLDDAQHPMIRSDAEMEGAPSIDDATDAALIELSVPNDEAEEEAPSRSCAMDEAAQEGEGGQLSQALDDLYPSDFLDVDT